MPTGETLSFTAACFSREKGYSLMIKTADRKNLSAVVFLRWEKGSCPPGLIRLPGTEVSRNPANALVPLPGQGGAGLANQGKGVMMVSSEMPELLGICDRILVMSNGRLAGIVERGKDFGGIPGEQETIMALAAKYV